MKIGEFDVPEKEIVDVAGIPTWKQFTDGYSFWWPLINEPFPFGDKGFHIGLSRHWIFEARMAGVERIKWSYKDQVYYWYVPDKKGLKQKEQLGDFKSEVIHFQDCPMKIYYFKL